MISMRVAVSTIIINYCLIKVGVYWWQSRISRARDVVEAADDP